MNKRRLMVYLDPGFLENSGHYMNFSRHIHAEAQRRHIDILHYVKSITSDEYCEEYNLVPKFSRPAFFSDLTAQNEIEEIVSAIDVGFEEIIAQVTNVASKYDEIVYYMYTGHPSYISSLARQLKQHDHGDVHVSAYVVLFYLSDIFCYGKDDGRYARFLREVSNQLEVLDPEGLINVGIDSDTALPGYSEHFSRLVTVMPFPHVQRAKVPAFPTKDSLQTGRCRITYTGYPHSKYGFHLFLTMLEHVIDEPYWSNYDFEVKLHMRIKENDLAARWESLKGKMNNLYALEGYMEEQDYLALIARADILLIPYGREYNHDTSAVLVDGLLGGCVVVAADQSWMANVFSRHGSGKAYKAENAASLISSVRDVVENIADYRARVSHNVAGLGWKFSAEGLFDMLFPPWRANLLANSQANYAAGTGTITNEIILPPPMGKDEYLVESEMSEQELEDELARLKELLKPIERDFLPGDDIDLPARISQMRKIASAWENRESNRSRFKELINSFDNRRCVVLGPDILLEPLTVKSLENQVVFAPQHTYRQFRATYSIPDFLLLESINFIQSHILDLRSLRGTIKFVPFHCAYLFEDDEDVVYYNHKPRKSYPHGYDVSLDAPDVTYTSCTLVGTTLQIAMSMGFQQVCILGVNVAEGTQERVELEKFYTEAANTAKNNDIELINVCIDTNVPGVKFVELDPFAEAQRKIRAVLSSITSGQHDSNWNAEELSIAERALLNRHPCPSDIYLPTTKYESLERVVAINKVVEAWNDRQDLYRGRLREARTRMQDKKRCFIIGNGPSLNQTNLDLLQDEVTFATNGIFLKFGDTKFRPTFFVVEDHLVGEDRYEEINQLSGFTKLSPYYLAYCLEDDGDVIYYNHRSRISYPDGFDFSTNAEEITYTGCTVTFSCMQLAYYMGFSEIYLIGVDMSYVIPEEVKKANEYDTEILDMDIDDPNHFAPNYFGRGYRWHDPNVDKMESAYVEARKVTEENGVKIYNATIGGRCEVFDRVDYYSLFGEAGIMARPEGLEAQPRLLPRPHYEAPASNNTGNETGHNAGAFSKKVGVSVTDGNPVIITLPDVKELPKIAVLELGDDVTDEYLNEIRVELNGHEITHSVHLDQSPRLIRFQLTSSVNQRTINIGIYSSTTNEGPGTVIYIDFIHGLPNKTYVKGEFPTCYFDGLQYLQENPDVATAVEDRKELSALSHFLSTGRAEGRKFRIATSTLPNHGWRFEWLNPRN